MNLPSWLQHLESLPSGLQNRSLDDVKRVAQKLDLLHFPGKVITVGGTNGKGSCVAFLEAILLAAGYSTGAYISPHILRYNERIRLEGKDVDDETLCQAFTQVEAARGDTVLSYFEFSALAALTIFKIREVDLLLLEVGLGGRFDAVNVVDADVAVISTISLDHTAVLGDTREAIGYEKAGIMRSHKPVVCGDSDVPATVYAVASELNAPLYVVDRDFFYQEQNEGWQWLFAENIIQVLPLPQLPIANAATALMVVQLLEDEFKIPNKAIIDGIRKASLPGRWQRMIMSNKEVIFDVAHNPESVALLAKNLQNCSSKGSVLAVVGMLNDKDIVATLQELTSVVDKWYIGAVSSARAASTELLQDCLVQAKGKEWVSFPTISQAMQQAIAECQRNDRIVVFGSFYAVAEGLGYARGQLNLL